MELLYDLFYHQALSSTMILIDAEIMLLQKYWQVLVSFM